MSLAVSPPLAAPVAGGELTVVFSGCHGILHDAGGRTGVLLMSPLGYEALSLHRHWRGLAIDLASAGFPTLRFDWPGNGDSLDGGGLESWRRAAREALALLSSETGVRRVLLVGQGLGAALALELAEGPHVAGVVLLAPVTNGRRYLRELTAWGAMIAAANLIRPPNGPSVGGFVAGPELAADLAMYSAPVKPGPPVALFRRAERAADAQLAEALAATGRRVETFPYEGYDEGITDPTSSLRPPAFDAVLAWARQHGDAPPRGAPAPRRQTGLVHEGFIETPVRFGPGGGLYGILTRPSQETRGAAVLIVGAGRDPHIGWARNSLRLARSLAGSGIASLRFDLGGIGDSAGPDDGSEVLYSGGHRVDVASALTELAANGFPTAVLVGRCSGAYLALQASDDPRVRGLVLVNPFRLVWNPAEDPKEAVRHSFRSLSTYKSRLFTPTTLRRILTGKVAARALLKSIAGRLARRAGVALAPVLPRSRSGLLLAEVRRRFASLAARDVPVRFLHSVGDGSLDEVAAYFGRRGAGLSAYANVARETLADADHNMTLPAAEARVLAATLELVHAAR